MQALEVTTFKLKRGHTIEHFLTANADFDGWLLEQSGYVSRRIA